MSESNAGVSGFLLVDKPSGETSHDTVQTIRKRFRTKSVGHTGTLDPMATGLLIVGIGEATKLIEAMGGYDKTYLATVALGKETHSYDKEGEEVRTLPVPKTWRSKMRAAVAAELARTEQIPPNVSAISVDGERAHAKVRAGVEFSLPPRPVALRTMAWSAGEDDSFSMRICVSKGYYVRALARDLGERLGTVAHLTSLRRETVGPFFVDHAGSPGEANLISVAEMAKRCLRLYLIDPEQAERVRKGQRVPINPSGWEGAPLVALFCGETLVATAHITNEGDHDVIRPRLILHSC